MKDTYIKIMIEKELKEEFIKACDGRPASLVIRNLIKNYVKKIKAKEIKNDPTDKNKDNKL